MESKTNSFGVLGLLGWALAATTVSGIQFSPTENCCSRLASELPGAVFRPNTTAYRTSVESYWSVSARELSPSCVVTPRVTKDVSTILRVLSPQSQDEPLCQFALRGGGHTPYQGAANIDYGVTIDMQSMNNVELTDQQSVVRIDAGNRWGKVYDTLVPYGLAVAGGGAANVGVAGYMLGGGISSFAGIFGWSADTVVNYEVVLAAGKVVNANATSKADLFQALKGGSNNFGIVTRFDMKTFKLDDIWAGFGTSSIEYFSETLEAIFEHANPTKYKPETTAIISFLWNHTDSWYIQSILQHSKPEPNPRALQPFTRIPSTASNYRVSNISAAAIAGAMGYPENKRFLFGTSTYYPDIELLGSVFEIMNRTLKSVPQDPDFIFKLSYQNFPSSMMSNSEGSTPNSLGLDSKIPYLINVRIEIEWLDAAKDFYYNRLVQRCLSLSDLEAQRKGLHHPLLPLNTAGPWQDVIGSYGARSVKQLKKTSHKYDVNGVFQLQVPGGFKLGA